jgi:ferritin-like protein
MASTGFHESEERLRPATRDQHRAIVSLMEELEAVDWYQQRVDATEDAELRAILAHNRDEELEHAAMVLEWLRRHNKVLDAKLRAYLFSEGSIVGREDALEHGAAGAANGATTEVASLGSLTSLGSLRGGR